MATVVQQSSNVVASTPAPFIGPVQQNVSQSAGVVAPVASFVTPAIPLWKTATSVVASLIPIVGEVYDGWTIYAQKDPITGEKLTLVGNAFTIIGLGTIAGSGKVAREIGERTLREIAMSKGVDYDLVVEAAEEVVKETDLLALAKAGKGGWDELVREIGERVVVKNAAALTSIASKIGSGHAFEKHIHEFADLNITNREKLVQHTLHVLKNPTRTGQLRLGRSYSYDANTNTLVVKDPGNPDYGTVFRPPRGEGYVDNLN